MKVISNMVWVLNIVEITACLVSFIYFHKLKASYWRWLPFYLLFIVCLEFTGRYFADTGQYKNNLLIFKYVGFPVQFLFFYFIFYNHEYFKMKKGWILLGIAIYALSLFFESIFFSDKYYWFNSFSYSIGNIVLLTLLLLFFLRFVQEKELLKFSENLMFWFCLGLLLYYLGTLPYWGLRNVLANRNRQVYDIYTLVMLILDCFMYSIFTIGIIRCKLK